MGCEYTNDIEDNDLYTAKAEDDDILYLPENEEIQFSSLPRELYNAIRNKFTKKNVISPKFFEISEEEFSSILSRNIYAKEIIKLFATQIEEIPYELDVKYKNVNPIKVLDPEGGIQYYEGGFNSQGQAHGKGIWIKDYSIYIGNFRKDEFYGTGLFITGQGYYYFGQWKNSQSNGYGSLMMDKKLVYQGNFKNCKKEGYGEERYPDGDIYKGAFYNGEKSGKGAYIFADGSRYDGNFKNSKYNGFGQLNFVGGNSVRGEFKDGELNGKGDLYWNDGSKFVGTFVDGKKNGEGTFVWNDGKSYKGIWNDNNVYGDGLIKDPNNRTQESIVIE